MSVFVKSPGVATTGQINEAQNELGYKFPSDFINYLESNNGGKFKEEHIKKVVLNISNSEKEEFPVTKLYGLCEDEIYDFLIRVQSYRTEPDWLLPIATVHGGPTFLLDLRDSKKGTVYLYVEEWPINPDPPFDAASFVDEEAYDDEEERLELVEEYEEYMSNYWPVAENFTQFLSLIGVQS